MNETDRKFNALKGLYKDLGIRALSADELYVTEELDLQASHSPLRNESLTPQTEPLIVIAWNSFCQKYFSRKTALRQAEGKYRVLSGENYFTAVKELPLENESSQLICHILKTDIFDEDILDFQKNFRSSNTWLATELIQKIFNPLDRNETYRFEIISIYYKLIQNEVISSACLRTRIEDSLNINGRYARMYNAIYQKGIKELRMAVCSNLKAPGQIQSSRDHLHITVAHASRISQYDPKKQKSIIQRIDKGESLASIIGEDSSNVAMNKDDIIDKWLDYLSQAKNASSLNENDLFRLMRLRQILACLDF